MLVMPQHQKTEPAETSGDLPLLSTEEEKLVEAWARGLNQSEAYKAGYGAEGYSPAALRVRACRKFAEPNIQAHIRSLQAVGLANAKLTREERIEALLAFAQRAENAGNYGAAGNAHKEVNELLGLKVLQVQQISADTTPDEKLRDIERKHGPEIAAALAAKHGIAFQPSETRH